MAAEAKRVAKMLDKDLENGPGRTPGTAEGEREPGLEVKRVRPGKTPGKAEGDRETERVNLGEPEEL
ncbi:MAG TPA: hypothetical protein DFS52_28780 [Myxococcales bacterium]|nr:hypothetical protein [Myxococcales bacterium]